MKKILLFILSFLSLTVSYSCDFTFNVKGLKVNFYSVSGTDTSNYKFFWNFGDGSSSTSAAAFHTYSSENTFTVSLTRISKVTYDTCKLSKQVQVLATTCLTSFAHNLNGTIVNIMLTDTDISGATLEWNFGDGTTKAHPASSHQYTIPGTYTITLTKQKNGETCTATKTITIAPSAFKYAINGTIAASGAPLDNGVVILYKKINQRFIHYRSASLGTSGTYSFNDIPGGSDYVLRAVPLTISEYFLTHLPTFSGNVTDWPSAEVISLNAAIQKNISLVLATSPTEANNIWNTGSDKLTGTVTSNTPIASKTAKTSAEVAVEGALITLYSENGTKLSVTYTDSDGNYEFTQLISGNYKLTISFPGIEKDFNVTATVDGDPATEESLPKVNIESSISAIKNTYPLSISVYPNPAQKYLHVQTEETLAKYKITITDLNSKIIYSEMINASDNIDVSALPSGIYMLKIELKEKSGVIKFIKE